ncbi:hypothetical protein VNO77_00595 [Canavalia gladiata]|uniref:Transmembrane protein n=1 Tax=Canavalia gladiata TaxID=3824 RepID=A0AAN9MUZ7_CANGL
MGPMPVLHVTTGFLHISSPNSRISKCEAGSEGEGDCSGRRGKTFMVVASSSNRTAVEIAFKVADTFNGAFSQENEAPVSPCLLLSPPKPHFSFFYTLPNSHSQVPSQMADWGPVVVAVVLFVLLSPGLLFQIPGRGRVAEFGNMQTSAASILVHAIIYFGLITIFLIAIGVHIYTG